MVLTGSLAFGSMCCVWMRAQKPNSCAARPQKDGVARGQMEKGL